jgi:DNA mismatch repair protein MutL
MSKVHILPADVISKIAAGEVVERPASVVKELLENSLDAGATRVEVHLKDGGKSLIHIKDDGCGISREDLEALFTRHATSKIASAEDLDEISSLGFRGEALYSVGSVAEVTLKSRAEGASEGWEITVKGGEKSKPQPAASATHGTDIRVNELFFNTPARKKFLKNDAAEFEQVLNVVMPYALLYPERAFLVTHNGRTALDLRPAKDPADRAAAALNLAQRHIITPELFEAGEVKIGMVLGDINIQRPRRDLQYLFVNGRPVQSRNLLFHVNETYKLILPPSVHPFFAVMLSVPAGDVDVNVHPTKREVRIREENRIGGLLRRAVERALMTQGSAKDVETLTFPTPEVREVVREEGLPADKLIFGPGQKGFLPEFGRTDNAVQPTFLTPEVREVAPEALKDRLASARFVGTFIRKYHLFEVGESLFVIDQHAAQERILFETFRRQIEAGQIEVQPLLVPVVFSATPQEMLAWENSGEKLKAFGFEVEAFGPTALAIQAHPAVISAPEQAVRLLLGEETLARADADTIARRACRASVMTGDRMASIEAVHQLKELFACKDPFTCPHGRPVFIELKSSFLDRQFLRT